MRHDNPDDALLERGIAFSLTYFMSDGASPRRTSYPINYTIYTSVVVAELRSWDSRLGYERSRFSLE